MQWLSNTGPGSASCRFASRWEPLDAALRGSPPFETARGHRSARTSCTRRYSGCALPRTWWTLSGSPRPEVCIHPLPWTNPARVSRRS